MTHIILLGDSIFDNAAYVYGGKTVVDHLRDQIPADWQVSLRAVDGSIITSIDKQLIDLPSNATHLVISIGGNDALYKASLLEAKVTSLAEALNLIANAAEEFEYHYQSMINKVLSLNIPTAISTIYYPRFDNAVMQRLAVTLLTVFNDIIIRQAAMAGLPILDLRLICDKDQDYANAIEPSVKGGAKIASVIARLIKDHNFANRQTAIFK